MVILYSGGPGGSRLLSNEVLTTTPLQIKFALMKRVRGHGVF